MASGSRGMARRGCYREKRPASAGREPLDVVVDAGACGDAERAYDVRPGNQPERRPIPDALPEHSRTLIPRNFQIQLGDNVGGPFTILHTANDFVAPTSPGQWFEFTFTPDMGQCVKLNVTETNAHTDGNFYVQIMEVVI
jgi:hypothetical protein